jgi:hypothetical protein
MPSHSRWIGRLVCACLALVVAAMAGVSPSAAGLGIFSTVGTEPDPLVGPFPLSVRPGQTTAVGVSLFTGQGTGFVKPTVSCCVDATTGAQVTPAGLTMSFRLPVLGGRAGRGRGYSPGIYLSPGATEVVTLTVAADTSAAPGQYAVKISASHPAMGMSEQTIFVNVLGPTPADDTVTPCSSQVNNVVVGNGTPPVAQVLPVMGATDTVFGVKAANQRDRVVAATHPRDSGAERPDYDLEVRGDLARAEARRLRAVVRDLLVDLLSTGRRLLAARVLVVRRRTGGDSPLVPQHLTRAGIATPNGAPVSCGIGCDASLDRVLIASLRPTNR